jgi:hypothetical protein
MNVEGEPMLGVAFLPFSSMEKLQGDEDESGPRAKIYSVVFVLFCVVLCQHLMLVCSRSFLQ